MSALPPKADMCGATTDVRFVPIADIVSDIRKTLEPFSVSPEGFQATSTNFRRFASASCASRVTPMRRGRWRRAGEPPEEAWSARLWNFVSTGAFPQNLGQLNAQIRRRERRV